MKHEINLRFSKPLRWLASGMLIVASACTEKIELDLGTTYARLVVEGQITTDTTAHTVTLSTTTDFYYNQPAPMVSGALVTITDGTDTIVLEEATGMPGVYRTPEDVSGVPGRTYTLHISLSSPINGQSEYEANCLMNDVNPIDSIGVKFWENWEVWEVQCYAWDPPEVNYYMFNLFKNGILMTDTINKVFATDDRLFNGNYTHGAGVGFLRKEIPGENVFPGDTIGVQIAGITREYLDFIWAVQLESGYQNPLISGPPANIPGNISNGAIGFFAAFAVKYKSGIVR